MREKTRIVLLTAFLAGLLALGIVPALAQDKPANNMQILREKVSADKKLLVATNLELTESEAKAFWPVYETYQEELFLLRTRTLKLIEDYAAAYESMNNDKARKLLDAFMTIDALGPKLRQAYLPKFRKVLPEVKVVRYYQIENKINAALMYELAAKIPLIKAAQ
jgi:Spy/CpxP family protein refolding chaperone